MARSSRDGSQQQGWLAAAGMARSSRDGSQRLRPSDLELDLGGEELEGGCARVEHIKETSQLYDWCGDPLALGDLHRLMQSADGDVRGACTCALSMRIRM